ncbi:MAG: glycoside hydrolase 100 family protein [Candidatus Solibacter sp.]
MGDSHIPDAEAGIARAGTRVPDEALERAVEVLRKCSHAAGINASAGNSGHSQIWARDSMITLLGACTLDDAQVRAALRASIAALAAYQSDSGCIPNNVDPATGKVNFRAYADGGLWFVIGSSLIEPDYPRMRRVLDWYACQDVDRSGLISIHEASDWQDLFCTRGKGLYVNCLYVMALRRAAEVARRHGDAAGDTFYSQRAALVKDRINAGLWYSGDRQMLPFMAPTFSTDNLVSDSLGRQRWLPSKRVLVDECYYLPYAAFRAVGEWFDSLGNLLAILSGVAAPAQADAILNLIERHNLADLPLRAIHPPVMPDDPDWRPYYGDLNQPNCYHNGGIWPFIGGFYVAALVKSGRQESAVAALQRLALLNRKGNFNEWHHGVTGEPLGVPGQAWSAGMYLYARECVRLGRLLFL